MISNPRMHIAFFPEGIRKVLISCLISYATGTLLSAAFLGMLPNPLLQAPAVSVIVTVLAGMMGFFVLDKLVIWRRSFDVPPPALELTDERHSKFDPRYAELTPEARRRVS